MPHKSYIELSLLNADNERKGKIRRRYLNLLEEDREVLCELALTDKALKQMQLDIARHHDNKYEKKPQTDCNKQKREDLQKLILNLQKEDDVKKEEVKKTNWIIEFRDWCRNVNPKQSLLGIKDWYDDLSPGKTRRSIVKSYRDTKAWAKKFSFSALTFKMHGWFTSFRLFLLRANRFPIMLKAVDPKAGAFSIFAAFIRIGGLSYLFNILFDLGIIINETFIQPFYDTDDKTYWQRAWSRFKAVIYEDRRIYRMANDLVWLAINAYGIFAGGPYFLLVNAMINVIGFGFDFCNDALLAFFKQAKYSFLGNYISDVVARQRVEMDMHGCDIFLMANPIDGIYATSNKYHLYLYRNGNKIFYFLKGRNGNSRRGSFKGEDILLLLQNEQFNSAEYANQAGIKAILSLTSKDGHTLSRTRVPGVQLSEEELKKLEHENKLLAVVRDKIEEKRVEVRNDNIRIVISFGLVVVGMFLVFFPPASLPGATLIGAGMALFFGSMTTGLGPRMLEVAGGLYKDVVDFLNDSSNEKKPPKNTDAAKIEMTDTRAIKQGLGKPKIRHALSSSAIKIKEVPLLAKRVQMKTSPSGLSLVSSQSAALPLDTSVEVQNTGCLRRSG